MFTTHFMQLRRYDYGTCRWMLILLQIWRIGFLVWPKPSWYKFKEIESTGVCATHIGYLSIIWLKG